MTQGLEAPDQVIKAVPQNMIMAFAGRVKDVAGNVFKEVNSLAPKQKLTLLSTALFECLFNLPGLGFFFLDRFYAFHGGVQAGLSLSCPNNVFF